MHPELFSLFNDQDQTLITDLPMICIRLICMVKLFINTQYFMHFLANTKPPAPFNVNCTRTAGGYQISWSYRQTPGRPQVQYFLIEYRRFDSLKWKSLGKLINWERRQWLIDTDILNTDILYEFRMFSFGRVFSEASNVAKTTAVIGMYNLLA